MRKQIKNMTVDEKLAEYERLERDIRLGHLPFSVEEADKRRQQEIYDSTDDIKERRKLALLMFHTCKFEDDFCTICGLDGRA